MGVVHDAIAAATPDREALVFGDRRFTWAQIAERSRRLANHLHAAGLGCHTERADLEPWESGQDHLAIYCYNGNEYLEAMLGAFKARVAPFNVNYRYGPDELRGAPARRPGHAASCTTAPSRPIVAAVRRSLPDLRVLLQVPDDSVPRRCCPGPTWYEDALAAAPADAAAGRRRRPTTSTSCSPAAPPAARRACCGARPTPSPSASAGPARPRRSTTSWRRRPTHLQALLAPPFMHGAGQWVGFLTWHTGGTVYLQRHPERLDPADIWSIVEQRAGHVPARRRRRLRPAAARRARSPALRPVVAHGRCCRAARPCAGPLKQALPRRTCRR